MNTLLYTRPHTLVYMPLDEKTPGEAIKELREGLGLSYREAAKLSESLSHSTIRNLENMPGSWEGVTIGTLEALARAYNVSLEYLSRLALGKEPYEATRDAGLKALERYEVHPKWMTFPVFGPASAGDEEPEPLTGDVVYIPYEHLKRRGANVETIRTYIVNGRCMVSEEVRTIEKNYAHGDYVAVDYSKIPEIGDTVVAWWPEKQMMVIKRYRIERDNIVLYPISPGHASLVLPCEHDVNIIGPVVWRGG